MLLLLLIIFFHLKISKEDETHIYDFNIHRSPV